MGDFTTDSSAKVPNKALETLDDTNCPTPEMVAAAGAAVGALLTAPSGPLIVPTVPVIADGILLGRFTCNDRALMMAPALLVVPGVPFAWVGMLTGMMPSNSAMNMIAAATNIHTKNRTTPTSRGV